ncbi:MAG: hypothetical protein JG781_1385 [Peptococcaceae bacterium]|jgi:hypothetical protein|nr:hypothetical protein [Peptococcaceae bacterium]
MMGKDCDLYRQYGVDKMKCRPKSVTGDQFNIPDTGDWALVTYIGAGHWTLVTKLGEIE